MKDPNTGCVETLSIRLIDQIDQIDNKQTIANQELLCDVCSNKQTITDPEFLSEREERREDAQ